MPVNPEGETAAPAAKPHVNWRTRKPNTPRLDAEKAVRQGEAVRLAIAAFGNAADATAFLNTPHDALGARPIDRALESADGLASVAEALQGMSR